MMSASSDCANHKDHSQHQDDKGNQNRNPGDGYPPYGRPFESQKGAGKGQPSEKQGDYGADNDSN